MRKYEEFRSEDWIGKAKTKYGDKFDYSCVKYKDGLTHVAIICSRHGLYMQTPNSHLSYGCKACNSSRLSKDEFFDYIKMIHGDKYDYSKTDYSPWHALSENILIACKEHGYFFQRIQTHQEGHGCPKCNGKNKIATPKRKVNGKDKLPIEQGRVFAVKLSFKPNNSEERVAVLIDPFISINAAEEFINNFKLFSELTDSSILEERIEEIFNDNLGPIKKSKTIIWLMNLFKLKIGKA